MIEKNFIDFYKNKNEKILKNSSILELEIFNNTNNIYSGIKNNITTIEEIPYYSCSQHVNLDNYIENKLNLLTNDEFKIFKQILEVKNLTEIWRNTVTQKILSVKSYKKIFLIKIFLK